MRNRRIFRPDPGARFRAAPAVATGFGLFLLLASVAVPRDLPGAAHPSSALAAPPPRSACWPARHRASATGCRRCKRRHRRAAATRRARAWIAAARRPEPWPRWSPAMRCPAGSAARIGGTDRRGRALGICRADGMDPNAALVTTGWALADRGAAPGAGDGGPSGRPRIPRRMPGGAAPEPVRAGRVPASCQGALPIYGQGRYLAPHHAEAPL